MMLENTTKPADNRRHSRSPESLAPTLHPNHMLSRYYGTPRPTKFVHRESQVRQNLWAAWSLVYDTNTLVIDMRYTTAPAPWGAQHVEGDLELIVSEISDRMGIVVGELDIIVRTDHNFPVGQPIGNDVDRPLSLVARPFEHQGVLEDTSVLVVDLVVATVHGHLSHESAFPQDRPTVEWPRRSSQSTPDPQLWPRPTRARNTDEERQSQADYWTPGFKEAIRERDGSTCRMCGTETQRSDSRRGDGETFTHLHDTPFGHIESYVLTCRRCNSAYSTQKAGA